MSQLPPFPDSGSEHSTDDEGPNRRLSGGSLLAMAVGIAFVVAFIVLHLTGILGPGAH